MSSGSKAQPTTQTQTTSMPAWLDNAAQSDLAFAKQVADRPLEQYAGQRIADLTPDQQQAFTQVRAQQGQTGNTLNNLSATAAGLAGKTAPTVQAGQLAGTNLSPYLNPYLGEVENNALTTMNRSRLIAQQGNEDRAIGQGAFGGSRQAVQQAATDADFGRQAGDLSANIRAQGFTQAVAGATGDINRTLSADQGNQGAYLQNLGLSTAAINSAGNLAQGAQAANYTDAGALENIGQTQQRQSQAGLDNEYSRFLERWNYPKDQLQTRLTALGAVPHGQTTVTTGAAGMQQGSNPAMGALGGAMSGAAAGSMLGPWGMAGGAVIGGIAGAMKR